MILTLLDLRPKDTDHLVERTNLWVLKMQMACYKTNSDNKISLSNDGNEEAVKARRNRTRRQPNCGMITTWHGEAVCFYSHPSSASQSVMLATVPPRKRPFSRQSCKTKLSSQEVFRSNLSSIRAFTPPELSELEIKQSQHFLAENFNLDWIIPLPKGKQNRNPLRSQ